MRRFLPTPSCYTAAVLVIGLIIWYQLFQYLNLDLTPQTEPLENTDDDDQHTIINCKQHGFDHGELIFPGDELKTIFINAGSLDDADTSLCITHLVKSLVLHPGMLDAHPEHPDTAIVYQLTSNEEYGHCSDDRLESMPGIYCMQWLSHKSLSILYPELSREYHLTDDDLRDIGNTFYQTLANPHVQSLPTNEKIIFLKAKAISMGATHVHVFNYFQKKTDTFTESFLHFMSTSNRIFGLQNFNELSFEQRNIVSYASLIETLTNHKKAYPSTMSIVWMPTAKPLKSLDGGCNAYNEDLQEIGETVHIYRSH